MNSPKPAWSTGKKISFRFFFLYFVLYVLLNPNDVLPIPDSLYKYVTDVFHQLIPWIGRTILHLSQEITIFTNGSGDTTYDNVLYLFILVMAAIGSLLWSILDQRRESYNTLYYWLTVVIRYYLGITLLSYGYAKLFKLQFPYPDAQRLLETYGDSSPMGLAWAFMGYSKGYNYFMGIAEVSAGVLLFFRRTTTTGALLSLLVSAQVMTLNYCFDIPVKLLSTTMVIMSCYLLAPNIRRIAVFLFTQRPTTLQLVPAQTFRKKSLRITGRVIKYLLLAWVIGSGLVVMLEARKQYGDDAPKPVLYGVYNTVTFLRNQDSVPPLTTDSSRWKQLLVDGSDEYASLTIKTMKDIRYMYEFKADTLTRQVHFHSYNDSTKKYTFTWQRSGPSDYIWKGIWRGDTLEVHLHKQEMNEIPLNIRGFHWISEYPFNR